MMGCDPLLELGAGLFADPARIAVIHHFPVLHPVRNPRHRHADLLQLDVFLGCRGSWLTAGGRIPVGGPAAAVFAPGFEHGHDLIPDHGPGECLSIKLACNGLPIPPLGPVVAEPGLARMLAAIARRAATAYDAACPAQALAHLVLLLGQWPRRGAAAAPGILPAEDVADAVVRTAAQQIAAAPVAPRTDRLARARGLSTRQFSRRFQAGFGCTPRAYANRVLVVRAQALLVQSDYAIVALATDLGFSSVHHFTRWFRRHAGQPPGRYRSQGHRL